MVKLYVTLSRASLVFPNRLPSVIQRAWFFFSSMQRLRPMLVFSAAFFYRMGLLHHLPPSTRLGEP